MVYKAQILETAAGGTGLSAAGTSGNVLTSNGTIWTSAAPSVSVSALTAWTPTLDFGGASVGITYTARSASYMKVGKICYLFVSITLSSKGTSTGIAAISGFPFSYTGSQTAFAVQDGNLTYTGRPIVANGPSSTFWFRDCSSGGASPTLSNTNFSNTTSINFSGVVATTT